jgi:phosphonate transport system substrate-binding protein
MLREGGEPQLVNQGAHAMLGGADPLTAVVENRPVMFEAVRPSPNTVARLEDDDVHTFVAEPPRTGQAAETGADDDHRGFFWDALHRDGRMPKLLLRLITYLAPGIPIGLYWAVADHLRAQLGTEVHLRSEVSRSGPLPGPHDPFARNEADIGFVCAPSYLALDAHDPPSVALLGVAAVHDDPRNAGKPVYFSELMVPRDAPAEQLSDLRAAHLVFNDDRSLSGYYCVLDRLATIGETRSYFGSFEASGSHVASLERLAAGTADVAAIDANALAYVRRTDPELVAAVRSIETLGPYPVQPVIVRRSLDRERREAARRALVAMHEGPTGRALIEHGVTRFAPVDENHYAPLRARLGL